MSLTAEAESLAASLDEVAMACAECFAAARCAGVHVPAIGQTAKAATILGAPLSAVQAQAAPWQSETEYLDGTEAIREALRLKAAEVNAFVRRARSVRSHAAAMMRRALRERKIPEYLHWLSVWRDAVSAILVAHGTLDACIRADRCLAWAWVRFAEAYEGAESDVARGSRLPHEGRWITGETPSRPALTPIFGGGERNATP